MNRDPERVAEMLKAARASVRGMDDASLVEVHALLGKILDADSTDWDSLAELERILERP